MAGLLSRLGRKKSVHIWSAVVVAAGSARRMEGIDKVLTTLGELPVLVHTLRVFQQCPDIAEIIVVTREDLMVEVGSICQDFALTKVRKVIKGGKERIHLGPGGVERGAGGRGAHRHPRRGPAPAAARRAGGGPPQGGPDRGGCPGGAHHRHGETLGERPGGGDGGPLHPVCRPRPPRCSRPT